jgi:hypothetical protein
MLRWGGVIAMALWVGYGCNLPPLSKVPTVCEPGTPHQCVSGALERCNQEGTGYVRSECDTGETCRNGACQPYQNECESELPFSLTGADMSDRPGGGLTLFFDSTDDLFPVSNTLELENCGAAPISIETAYLQKAHSAHETTRWSLAQADALAGFAIEPKESKRLEVTYAPLYGFTVEPATLRLGIEADRTEYLDVDLQPRIPCLTVPPRIDAGELEAGVEDPKVLEIPVQNCGNVDLQVRIPSVRGDEKVDLGWPDDGPIELGAGEVETISLQVTPKATGRTSLPIKFQTTGGLHDGLDAAAQTLLEVPAAAINCQSDFGRPTVHVRRTPPADGAGSLQDPRDWAQELDGTVAPFESVDLHVESHRNLDVDVVESPRGSAATLEPKSAEDHWTFVPDVVGSYRIEVTPFDDYGYVGCTRNHLQIQVEPDSELHAELTWETADDPIAEDRGYGRGVDINLHALAHFPSADSDQLSGWQRPGDCVGRGRNAQRDCVYGNLMSTSVTGMGPESISFGNVTPPMIVFVGRVWHPYGFGDAGATFRLWHEGTLVSETPVSRVLDGAIGRVWHIGTWSRDEQALYLTDELRTKYPREAEIK